MTTPISVLSLLMTAGALLGLDPEHAQYKREAGRFTNTPSSTAMVRFPMACSAKCTAMKQWFCGGFTYLEDGTCHLHEGNNLTGCINPEELAAPLEVDERKSPRSYRRSVNSTCPGTASSQCSCPEGFSRCGGRCLQLIKALLTCTKAKERCAGLGGHLVVPRSDTENRCALEHMGLKLGFIFIGVTRPSQDEAYVAADGTCGAVPASQSWWGHKDPDHVHIFMNPFLLSHALIGGNTDLKCAVISNGKWFAAHCRHPFYSLCQLSDCYRPDCP